MLWTDDKLDELGELDVAAIISKGFQNVSYLRHRLTTKAAC